MRRAANRQSIEPLTQFLRGKLVRVRKPGSVTAYSSFGMTLAGLVVEDVSKEPFETYLLRHVWAPLHMQHTHITPGVSAVRQLATGYAVVNGVAAPVEYEWYHSTPASSINSTAADMATFMMAMLSANSADALMSRSAKLDMMSRHATMHPRIPGWALGWQEADNNGRYIVEHGGDIAGFASLLMLIPDQRFGLFIAHHVEGSNLRFLIKKALLDRYFNDSRSLAKPMPQPLPDAQRFVGTYRWNIYCHSCGEGGPRLPEVAITANADGSLNLVGKKWVRTDSLYFRSTDGADRLGFAADSSGKITHLTGGSWQVFEKIR